MSIEAYEKMVADLGIDRGQLATGFEAKDRHEMPSEYIDPDAPMKVRPPPIMEDFSHLNIANRRAKVGKLLAERGTSYKAMAEQIGVSEKYIHRLISTREYRAGPTWAALWAMLTPQEQEIAK